MPTPASHSLDELEIALDTVAAQMQRLFDENARLRSQLAEASERMRMAGHKLRVVAERLPQAAVAVDAVNTNGADVAQAKAA
jgi:hypothetical protein